MLIYFAKVFVRVGIKSVVGGLVVDANFGLLTRHLLVGGVQFLLLPLVNREEVDRLVLENFPSLNLP